MKLTSFRFLIDENISDEIVEFLRRKNIEVESIKEKVWFGMTDKAILEYALQHQLIVLTQDSDFGTLIYRDKSDFHAIIYLRPEHFDGQFHIPTLRTLLLQDWQLKPPFIITAENTNTSIKVRLRIFD